MGGVVKMLMSPLAAIMPKPKAPKPVYAPPQAQDNSASVLMDAVAGRSGSSANRRTGSLGSEAGSGKKTSLGA